MILFRVEPLLIPVAALALSFNYEFSVMEVLWTFSIYLEAVAILPQLFMVYKVEFLIIFNIQLKTNCNQQTGEAEIQLLYYLFALGSYRALYIVNWIYRYYDEGFQDWIVIGAGIVQIILYCDFSNSKSSIVLNPNYHI